MAAAELQEIQEEDDVFKAEKPSVRALYAYNAQSTKDISMKKGEMMKLISSSNKASDCSKHCPSFCLQIHMIRYSMYNM